MSPKSSQSISDPSKDQEIEQNSLDGLAKQVEDLRNENILVSGKLKELQNFLKILVGIISKVEKKFNVRLMPEGTYYGYKF